LTATDDLPYMHALTTAPPPSVSPSYKADLWRYCALFTFGGWFLDAEDVPLLRLSALHRPCDRLVLVRDQCPERDDAQATGPCRQPAVQISLLGAAPRHPFLSCCLAMAVRVRRACTSKGLTRTYLDLS